MFGEIESTLYALTLPFSSDKYYEETKSIVKELRDQIEYLQSVKLDTQGDLENLLFPADIMTRHTGFSGWLLNNVHGENITLTIAQNMLWKKTNMVKGILSDIVFLRKAYEMIETQCLYKKKFKRGEIIKIFSTISEEKSLFEILDLVIINFIPN